MNDIFEDWKKSRFILTPKNFEISTNHLVVLTDPTFWSNNLDELLEWCNNNVSARVQGMTVEIADDATLTNFILRWS